MANAKRSYSMVFDTKFKSNPTKLLVVKNLKQKPLLPDNYQEQTWKILSEAVISIQTRTPIRYTLEELYQTVENVCNNNLAAALYTNLVEIIEKHVKTFCCKFTYPTRFSNNILFLKHLDMCWSLHCDQMLMIRRIFLYLDQTYVLKNPKIKSIWEMGLNLFYCDILLDKYVQNRAVKGILLIIENERKGEMINTKLLRSMLRMISDFKLYHDIFEEKFIRASERLYATEGLHLINKLEVHNYLHHIQKRLNEEHNRYINYLDESTKWPIIRIVEKHLIMNHISSILEGLEELLNENRRKELKLLYCLLTRLKEGLTEICTYFNAYIKKYGQAIIIDPGNDKGMIQDLLHFKEKMDFIINICFQSNIKIINSAKEAFESFLGLRINKPALLIAKFIDMKLKVNNKGSMDDFEKLFDKIIYIFRLINGKDVFEAFYKKDLAKRLLFGTSISIDAEKSILSKLKQECGGGFTSKLEIMFKDMLISKDLNVDYKQYLKLVNDVKLSGIDMVVNVVSMGNWPTFPIINLTIPNEILQYQECFNKFYLAKHKSRKLQWLQTHGHCMLRSYFKKGTKELQVSLFQAVVLLLFNDCEMLPFNEIKIKTNINDLELKRVLQSLACGKVQVLIKKSKGQKINDNDSFSINNDFHHKLYRIKINQMQIIETHNEQMLTEEKVYHDRNYQIEAALVRIMKMRKSLLYNNLISELYQLLKFPVKLSDVKNRIESLVDRQYMERDKDNTNLYNYIL